MEKSQHGRKDRLIKQKRHDAYLETNKLPEPRMQGSIYKRALDLEGTPGKG